MNGISSNLQDEIKKTKELQKKTNFKFIATIVSSNILVALLCLPTPSVQTPISPQIKKISHQGYQKIVLPLSLLIPNEELTKEETIITLASSENKILVQKAYLHDEISTGKSLDDEEKLRQFTIEIPSSSVAGMSDFFKTGVVALPYVEAKIIRKTNRGSKYEVSF